QEPRHAGHAAVAHHEQVVVAGARRVDQRRDGLTLARLRVDGDARARVPLRLRGADLFRLVAPGRAEDREVRAGGPSDLDGTVDRLGRRRGAVGADEDLLVHAGGIYSARDRRASGADVRTRTIVPVWVGGGARVARTTTPAGLGTARAAGRHVTRVTWRRVCGRARRAAAATLSTPRSAATAAPNGPAPKRRARARNAGSSPRCSPTSPGSPPSPSSSTIPRRCTRSSHPSSRGWRRSPSATTGSSRSTRA